MERDEIIEIIKESLSIQIDSETNDFMTTDCSTSSRLTVSLYLGDDLISQSSVTA